MRLFLNRTKESNGSEANGLTPFFVAGDVCNFLFRIYERQFLR